MNIKKMKSTTCLSPVIMAFSLLTLSIYSDNLSMNISDQTYANHKDYQRAILLEHRSQDWRNGAIIYQVIVDRFNPPSNLDAKKHLYPTPKILHPWTDKPTKGKYLEEVQVWSHEIDFWGGDLNSLAQKLDYINNLGADVLYLNPIHKAFTNHKYDAQNYFEISPEYGSLEDLKSLAQKVHDHNMHLVLDGVFNHVGRSSPWFQEALHDPSSPWRQWFYIDPKYKYGYRAWANVQNLPEICLENPTVQNRIFRDPDSVIQQYLKLGADGWRLDVAFDIGYSILSELTAAAHSVKSQSLIVGEIWNYPEEWTPSIDAVMNFHARQIIMHLVSGNMSGAQAARLFQRMIQDTGLEPVLKSWIVLDNHDTHRLNTMLPELWKQQMAQILQFTIPGSPCIYYGVELGMTGGEDPENRAPMQWELNSDENETLVWTKKLINIRNNNRALCIGDFRYLDSEKLLAFMRQTDRVKETTVILANPTSEPISEVLGIRDSKLMNWSHLKDAISGETVQIMSGTIHVTVPPQTAWILQPDIQDTNEYTPYKRIQ